MNTKKEHPAIRGDKSTRRRVALRLTVTAAVEVLVFTAALYLLFFIAIVSAPEIYAFTSRTWGEEQGFEAMVWIIAAIIVAGTVIVSLLSYILVILPLDTWAFRKGAPRHRK